MFHQRVYAVMGCVRRRSSSRECAAHMKPMTYDLRRLRLHGLIERIPHYPPLPAHPVGMADRLVLPPCLRPLRTRRARTSRRPRLSSSATASPRRPLRPIRTRRINQQQSQKLDSQARLRRTSASSGLCMIEPASAHPSASPSSARLRCFQSPNPPLSSTPSR